MSVEAKKALEALRIQAEAQKTAERAANYSAFVNILSKSYDSRTQDEHTLALNLFSELCAFFPPVPSHLQATRQSALEYSYPHFSYNLFSRGSTLCTAGTPCTHVIFLMKGSVSSQRAVSGGVSTPNSNQFSLSAGNIIGEIEATRSDGRWESTLIGIENGEYLSINKSAFAHLFELGTYVSLSEATILMRIRGFHRLGPIETLMTLCTGIQRRILSSGTIYMKEGDPMTSTVLVKDGSIRVCRKMPDEIRVHEKSGDPFNFHEYRSHFFKPTTDKEHLVTLSMVGRDEMLCYPFKQGPSTPKSEFTYVAQTGSILLFLNLDQFKGKLNISTLGRNEIRKYMAKIDGQRMGRCNSFSKASEYVGTMMQDRSKTIAWQESFAARDETIAPPVILPELIGSPSKSKVGQNTALDSKIGHEHFATLSAKLINMRKVAALSLDSAAVSDTYSYAAVSKAQNFQKNQYDKSYQERSRKFNEIKRLTADYSFSNLPENSGFSLLLRRSMELIGSFEEGSLAHKALSPQSAHFLQATSLQAPKLNAKQLQNLSRAPILSPKYHSKFAEESANHSFETLRPSMQLFDSRELGIVRHARNTLSIRHQQPLYVSRQTLELSPNTSLDRSMLASQYQTSSTPSPKHPSSRSKSQLCFSIPDAKHSFWLETDASKDSIPHERQGLTVRPCSHNTPRPRTSGSTSDRVKSQQ